VEGVLLDQYSKDDGVCPFEIDPKFNITDVVGALRSLDMRMYLGIKASIPIGMGCVAETSLNLTEGCFLTKNGSKTDVEIGLMKKLDADGT